MRKHSLLAVVALAATLFALPASAQWYVGAGLGRSHFTEICTVGPCKTRDTAFDFFAGYQLIRFVGVEAAYDAFGHASVLGTDIKGDASSISGVLTVPLTRRFAIFGKAGGYHGNLKSASVSQRKNGATFGLGLEYDFDPRAGLRLQYQRFRKLGGTDIGLSTDIEVYTLQALFRF